MGDTDRNLRKTTASQVDCPAIRPWQPSARSNGWNSHRDYARMGNVRQRDCFPDPQTTSPGGDGYMNTQNGALAGTPPWHILPTLPQHNDHDARNNPNQREARSE